MGQVFEGPVEVRQIVETAFEGYRDDRAIAVPEELFRMLDPQLLDVVEKTGSGMFAEETRQRAFAHDQPFGYVIQSHWPKEIIVQLGKKVLYSSFVGARGIYGYIAWKGAGVGSFDLAEKAPGHSPENFLRPRQIGGLLVKQQTHPLQTALGEGLLGEKYGPFDKPDVFVGAKYPCFEEENEQRNRRARIIGQSIPPMIRYIYDDPFFQWPGESAVFDISRSADNEQHLLVWMDGPVHLPVFGMDGIDD